MSDLPLGWVRTSLGRVIEVHDSRRMPVNAAERARRSGPFPYYGANGQAGTIDDYLFDGEFVLLAEDGGYFADPSRTVAYRATGKFWVNNHAHVLTPKGCLESRFLLHALNATNWMPHVSGTTRPKLTQGAMVRAPFALPPLNEQRRIVAKLESLQARSRRAREALDAVPPLIEKLRQSILAVAFRGDLTKDWRAQHKDIEPASELLKRIRIERRKKWEEAELAKLTAKGKPPTDDRWKGKYKEPKCAELNGLPVLPRGWCWASAEQICHEITVGHVGPMEHRYTASGIPFLRSQNVRANKYDPVGLKYIPADFHSQLAKSRLVSGDLVVVRSGAPGTACVVPDELMDANCADLIIARLVPLIDAHLSAFYMNSSYGAARVLAANVGVAQQHFNVGAMRDLPMPVMPPEEQAALKARLKTLLDVLGANSDRAAAATLELSKVEVATLASAFRGELVPQDPNDEPADALIARLRERQ